MVKELVTGDCLWVYLTTVPLRQITVCKDTLLREWAKLNMVKEWVTGDHFGIYVISWLWYCQIRICKIPLDRVSWCEVVKEWETGDHFLAYRVFPWRSVSYICKCLSSQQPISLPFIYMSRRVRTSSDLTDDGCNSLRDNIPFRRSASFSRIADQNALRAAFDSLPKTPSASLEGIPGTIVNLI